MSSADQAAQALVIGVSKYQYLLDLTPNKDAQGVREVLAKYCAYPHDRITMLEQEQATRANIVAALASLAEATKQASRTFLYYSGHGGQGVDGDSYILPFDARKKQYSTTALSTVELSAALDRCAGEVTVVLDCCYAAGMANTKAGAGSPVTPETVGLDLEEFGDQFRNDIQSKGRAVFAACRPDKLAYGSASYGLFTGHLLDGLCGKASTDGLDVNVAQLFNYVQKNVASASMNKQQPSFIASIESFYRLTRYPERLPPSVVFEKDVYISYDRRDLPLRQWVEREFQPELEKAGRSIWDYDDLATRRLEVQDAIKRSKYSIVLLTPGYFRNLREEFNSAMAILQAIDTRTPRFIPILREPCDIPLSIETFVGLDMTDSNRMEFRHSIDRLNKRLKKEPHER